MQEPCKATPEELEEIRKLHTRKIALKELVYSLNRMDPRECRDMYERVVNDLGETCLRFDRWWVEAARKYGLEGRHEVDFGTGALVKVG